MRTALFALLLLLGPLALAACGGSDPDPGDASSLRDAARVDAVPRDGAGPPLAALCEAICDKNQECPDVIDCSPTCESDLADFDCTPAELDAIGSCLTRTCSALLECLGPIACLG